MYTLSQPFSFYIPLLLHPGSQGALKPNSTRSALIRASLSLPLQQPHPEPPPPSTGSAGRKFSPAQRNHSRPISGLPRATGGRTLSVRFPSEASARGPQLPSPFGHPTSKLSLSLRPVQPPSCKKLKSDSQLPPSHQPVPLPRSAPSQAARMDCRGLGCCVRRGG